MVSTRDGQTTLTAGELAALAALDLGPAETGKGTKTFTRGTEIVRQVDRTIARRLARAGLAWIDAGGIARLTEPTRRARGGASGPTGRTDP